MTGRRLYLTLFLVLFILSSPTISIFSASLASSASIDIEGARWNTNALPVKVLVVLNQWSNISYAAAVHEALNTWASSMQAYINLTKDTTLNIITFAFYISGINSTSNPNMIVNFSRDEIPPNPGTIGLTTYDYNPRTHYLIAPVNITMTTYGRTVDSLFVKDVSMHEPATLLGWATQPNSTHRTETQSSCTPPQKETRSYIHQP